MSKESDYNEEIKQEFLDKKNEMSKLDKRKKIENAINKTIKASLAVVAVGWAMYDSSVKDAEAGHNFMKEQRNLDKKYSDLSEEQKIDLTEKLMQKIDNRTPFLGTDRVSNYTTAVYNVVSDLDGSNRGSQYQRDMARSLGGYLTNDSLQTSSKEALVKQIKDIAKFGIYELSQSNGVIYIGHSEINPNAKEGEKPMDFVLDSVKIDSLKNRGR